MLLFALLSVFIAGLMVGRTPEYLGKKIQGPEMKLVVLYILFVPLGDPRLHRNLGGDEDVAALAEQHGSARPHRDDLHVHLAGNNNGSAFAGLTGNTDWFNVTARSRCSSVGSS